MGLMNGPPCALALNVTAIKAAISKIFFILLVLFYVNNLFSYNHAAAGLMSGQDEHFCIDSHISDVVAREGLDALIELGGTIGISVETDVAEVGLYKAGLEIGDADGSVGHVNAESVGEGFHCCLRGAVDIASGIGGIACHTPYINNVSVVACYHLGYDEARHRQQPLDIGVDHGLPVVGVTLVFWLEAQCEASIIDEYVDLLPLLRQALDGLAGSLAVSDVKSEDEHVGALGLQLLTDGFQLLNVTAVKDEPVAISGEFVGAAEADAARGACNENGLVHISMLCQYLLCGCKDTKKSEK